MPILDANSLEFFSHSPEQTRRLGSRLGELLKPGDLICLSGELGAGKTTMVQGIAQGWGSTDRVTSPTFVLVNQYNRADGQELNHLDAYRLQNAVEAEDLDPEFMLEKGALVVEWADRISKALPDEKLEVQMRWMAEEYRGMVFHAHGNRYESMLEQFRQSTFGGG
jgi:tRNA threonylcarbamoyladenosine biosynthesis protein TsaE